MGACWAEARIPVPLVWWVCCLLPARVSCLAPSGLPRECVRLIGDSRPCKTDFNTCPSQDTCCRTPEPPSSSTPLWLQPISNLSGPSLQHTNSSQTKPYPPTSLQMALMVPKSLSFSFLTVSEHRGLGMWGLMSSWLLRSWDWSKKRSMLEGLGNVKEAV